MPTYVVSLSKGRISDQQKSAIAEALTRIHSEETGAPAYFVQVIIDERNESDQFLGGSRASHQVWIRGDIRAGRPEALRSAMMLRMMREVAVIVGAKEDDIWVYLCNIAPTDMVEYGHVLPRPGEEAAWFEALPKSLQDYLLSLGTSKSNFAL